MRRGFAHTALHLAVLALSTCALACQSDARPTSAETGQPGVATTALGRNADNDDGNEPADAAPDPGGFGSTADVPATAALDGPARVRRGTLVRTLLLTGELRAVQGHPIIVPPTPSWETQIRFVIEDGVYVETGDRLVELDTGEVASQLNDAETAVQRAINELASKKADVDGRRAERQLALDRARIELAKAELEAEIPQDVQSERQFEQRRLALEQARVAHAKASADLESYEIASEAELEVLRIDVDKAERELSQAQRAIDTMALVAPASGIAVVSVNYREGRKFQEGDNAYVGAEIVSIPDLSRMMVEARLSDVDDGEITPGMRAYSTLDAFPGRRLAGTVRSIGPVAQEINIRSMQRYFRVIVDLQESDPERMLPGMSVQVEVETVRLEDTLLVPRSAIDWSSGSPELLLANGGAAIEVQLGPCNAFECALTDGPDEGTELLER